MCVAAPIAVITPCRSSKSSVPALPVASIRHPSSRVATALAA